jgi:DNA polymerase-3 subunit gamma/tau
MMANESRHMDIIEMDAASNRKIDDIRELIEHTKYKPSTARYKIFIIDEVHMLTKEAFNALLKTLEEPPEFVKFILATTDALKLPATILSRTQHFRFRKISQKVLVQHLAHILNLEGVSYEESALEIIARSGAGSVRDSLTLLDQAIVYSKNFIDTVTVTNMLGIIEPSMLEGLLKSIFAKDEAEILAFIKEANEFESEMVIDELMLYLKEILLSGSEQISPLIIERFFRVLAESKTLLNMGSDGEFVLSLTLFKMMEALKIKDIDTMIRSLEQELSGVELKAVGLQEKEKPLMLASKASISLSLVPKLADKSVVINVPEADKKEKPTPKVVKEPIDKGIKLFEELIAKIYDRNYELGQSFQASIVYSSFKEKLLIWESSASKEEKVLLRNNWGLIRLFVQEVFGIETKIKNIAKKLEHKLETSQTAYNEILVEPSSTIEDEVLNQPSISSDSEMLMKSSCVAPEHDGVESAKEKDERTILYEPMIAKALELFSPKKVRIKRKG